MLIQRCAWHAFFRGYPRPLRVLSWHGRGVAFSDSICPSCADRVRNEGLWGSPPPPVWPGSPQTALIFVGLPLLTALVLLATPLHDAAPPTPREEAAAPLSLPAPEPRVAKPETGGAAMPRAVAKRQPVDDRGVPAVIYETRRTRHRAWEDASTAVSGSAPAVMATRTGGAWLHPAATPESITLTAPPANADARATATSLATQSP
jgi:hypothetical protein